MARIRKWMRANPEEAREVRQTNRSFVFFRITGLGDEGEPVGGQGIRLTPGRSIAVDKALHAYGTPFFIEADLPIESDRPTGRFRRLMIAQVTVRFVSQLVSVTRDRSGTVIEGSPEKVTEVTDVWTFARDMSSRDPNWKLVATEAGQ